MSNTKKIIFDVEARQKLSLGIQHVINAVQHSFGPKGFNLNPSANQHSLDNNGYFKSRQIVPADQYEEIGVSILKDASSTINNISGNGSITCLLLIDSIVKEGIKHLSLGANIHTLKEEILSAAVSINTYLTESLIAIKSHKDFLEIVKKQTSLNPEIDDIIYNTFNLSGENSSISIIRSPGIDTYIDICSGISIPFGYASSYFVSDKESMSSIIENPYIIITLDPITSFHDLFPILRKISQTGRGVVVFCPSISKNTLSTLIMNRIKSMINICVIQIQADEEAFQAYLKDLTIYSGSTLLSKDLNTNLKQAKLENLGSCDKASISSNRTIITGRKELDSILYSHIEQIKRQKQNASISTQRFLDNRLARLQGQLATINICGNSSHDMSHKQKQFESNVRSLLSIRDNGYIIGGGVSLFNASLYLQELADIDSSKENFGLKIMATACLRPLEQLIINSGYEPVLIISAIKQINNPHYGFNAISGGIENMLSLGIVDSLDTIINAINVAASTANTILSTEVIIGDDL